jgi:hypothetical protein
LLKQSRDLSTRFTHPLNTMLNDTFSCPYCLCFPLSCSLLPCPQSTFSHLVSHSR